MQIPQNPAPPDSDDGGPTSTPLGHASPLVQWLQTTAGPYEGLDALHCRLAAISGSMTETVQAERDDRL